MLILRDVYVYVSSQLQKSTIHKKKAEKSFVVVVVLRDSVCPIYRTKKVKKIIFKKNAGTSSVDNRASIK